MFRCVYLLAALILIAPVFPFGSLVNLSPTELKDWYSADELYCINYDGPPSKSKVDCRRLRLFDRCSGPYNRNSYKKGIEGFTNFKSNTVRNLVFELLRRNVTLIFAGDSLSTQRLTFLGEDARRAFKDSEWLYNLAETDGTGNNAKMFLFHVFTGTNIGNTNFLTIEFPH